MDLQDIRTLKLLETIDEANNPPSQRDMAKSLNVSLGLVNSFLKRLVKKGYFKITHLPRNRVGYILTPKGAAEKSRLTYNYIQYSYRFYKDTRKRFRILFQNLFVEGHRKVAFYGVGDLAEIAYLTLQESDLTLVALSDCRVGGRTFFHNKIIAIDKLAQIDFDALVLTNDSPIDETFFLLIDNGIDPQKIKTL